MSTPKVSVIIPVYKAEQYIERCVRSLFEQTLNELEYIFIDDSSPDNSIKIIEKILEEYPNRKEQVKIIRHPNNLGVGQARQDGIDKALGEYIIHCDPDDWVDKNYYENLYQKAIEDTADVVIGKYNEESESHSRENSPLILQSKKDIFHQITTRKIHCGLWNKLIKTQIAKKYKISGQLNLWEDVSVIIPILINSEKISYSFDGTYHYQINNSNSIIHQKNRDNALSQINAIKICLTSLQENNNIIYLNERDILKLKWDSKSLLVYNPTRDNCNTWRTTFPECNFCYASIGLKYKGIILSWLLNNHLDFVVKIIINLIKKVTRL